jgi:hypothetical protein
MSTGTGIAILGVWLLPAACSFVRTVTAERAFGWWCSVAIAGTATFLLSHYVG